MFVLESPNFTVTYMPTYSTATPNMTITIYFWSAFIKVRKLVQNVAIDGFGRLSGERLSQDNKIIMISYSGQSASQTRQI